MALLSDAIGGWTGTNGFRLLPGDPFAEFPATLTVTSAAAGHLAAVAYSWTHPDDGPQEGLLVIGAGEGEGALVAMWGDSWHQRPSPMTLSGSRQDPGAVVLEGDYGGGWLWRISVAAGADGLRLRMDNVIPADQATDEVSAGPYAAMLMTAHRA
ncbi:hypothetical protein [Allonocardiopsis opalescens]|uniref:DUF1579 domain-containing protein n=1 Tax=Allonocardiopsis opalescens TaxID=1144618 RepID=A0A2T0Q827_9ACTN|nr:hypothetical protein [Allonocardiopsis opalescens]PRX99942.1 hypothetical protein CLV72_103549 [Allonocardiopsis opalescens]